jgi:pimeloyl-ACP methyl ester carboxylesterase
VAEALDVEVPSGRIHAERRGAPSAPLAIGIPGLSANLRGFDFIAERVAGPDRGFLALDLRGRGLSDVTPQGTYGWPAHAKDVLAVADALGARTFAVVGQSMGAAVAMEMARMAPDRLTHVVLIDAAGAADPSTAGPILASAQRLGAVVQQLGTVRPWSDYWERYFRYELAPVDGGVRARSDRSAVLEDATYGSTHDPHELWPYLVMPTLLLRATVPLVEPNGFITPASVRDAFVREVPRGKVVEVGANHYGINTHPDSVAAIKEFLAS